MIFNFKIKLKYIVELNIFINLINKLILRLIIYHNIY